MRGIPDRQKPPAKSPSSTSTRTRNYVRNAARLALQAAEALDHAHARGILHRDIKPANLLLDREGRLWVTDFGLAQVRGDDRLTLTGDVLGTLRYMSPEQALGQRVVIDGRTDVYSLGVTLYELLSLRPAIDGRDRAEILRRVAEEEPAPLRRLNPAVPADLETIVLKATAKDPAGRYATAQELAEDLRNFLEDRPIRARRPGLLERAGKWARRHRSVVTTAALWLVLGTAVSTWEAIRAGNAESRAKASAERALTEASVARAVNDFLREDLLAQASPEKHPDRDLKLRTVLDLAAVKIAGRFAQQPLVEAAIRQTTGDTYSSLGLPREARPHLERARDLRLRVLGEEQPETLEATTSLAAALSSDGQSDRAEPLLIRVIEVGQRALGKEHLQVLRATNELGWVYLLRKKLVEAEPLLLKSLEGCRRVLGEGHPQTLLAMHNLAAVYRDEGKLPEARSLVVQMLELNRRDHGEEYPDTLEAIEDLAKLYQREKKLEEAECLLVKVVEICRRVQGEAHPSTLNAMSSLRSLAIAFKNEGKVSQAEALFIKVLEIHRRVLGEEHSGTLHTLNCLACFYHDQGKLSQAEPLFIKVLEISRRVRGEEHPDTLVFMGNLARLYHDQRKLAQVESLLVRMLEVRRRTQGEKHTDTLATMHNLAAMVYKGQGKFAEAEPLFVKVLELGRPILG
jgi:tetratricopeptide (TPR) repeat protein